MRRSPLQRLPTVAAIIAGIATASCGDTYEPLPDVPITMVGTLTWDDGEPVVAGTAGCEEVDIWVGQGGGSILGDGNLPLEERYREIHATTNANGDYTLRWLEFGCVLPPAPNYRVTCSWGQTAVGSCTGHPYTCQTGAQTRDCVFTRASCGGR